MADDIQSGDDVRIKPRDPATAAGADKLRVLAIGTSMVTKDRRWALVENDWGIVQAFDVAALEPWPTA